MYEKPVRPDLLGFWGCCLITVGAGFHWKAFPRGSVFVFFGRAGGTRGGWVTRLY